MTITAPPATPAPAPQPMPAGRTPRPPRARNRVRTATLAVGLVIMSLALVVIGGVALVVTSEQSIYETRALPDGIRSLRIDASGNASVRVISTPGARPSLYFSAHTNALAGRDATFSLRADSSDLVMTVNGPTTMVPGVASSAQSANLYVELGGQRLDTLDLHVEGSGYDYQHIGVNVAESVSVTGSTSYLAIGDNWPTDGRGALAPTSVSITATGSGIGAAYLVVPPGGYELDLPGWARLDGVESVPDAGRSVRIIGNIDQVRLYGYTEDGTAPQDAQSQASPAPAPTPPAP